MSYKEVDDMLVREYHFISFTAIDSLLLHQDTEEVNKRDHSLLILVDLSILDLNHFVASVFSDVQHNFVGEHHVDHVVICGVEQEQDVITSDVEVGIFTDSDLEFSVLTKFSNDPGVMDKVTTFFLVLIHDKCHEVITDHAVECSFHEPLDVFVSSALQSTTRLVVGTLLIVIFTQLVIITVYRTHGV